MHLFLTKDEFEKIYPHEQLKITQSLTTSHRYTYLDQSKTMVYIKDSKNTGDEYHAYSVRYHGESVNLHKSDVTKDEIDFFNELIAGTEVERSNKNFFGLRKPSQRKELSTDIDILHALNLLNFPVIQCTGRRENKTQLSHDMVPISKKNGYPNRLFSKHLAADKSNINFDLEMQQKAQYSPLQKSLLSGFIGFWQPKIVNEKDNNQVTPKQLHSIKL